MQVYIYYLCDSEVAESCPTLCDSVDCSPPGSSVHGVFLARISEWVAISFSFLSWPVLVYLILKKKSQELCTNLPPIYSQRNLITVNLKHAQF